MLRILFLIRALEIGGAERQLVELIRNMDRKRFDIQVVTFYDGGPLRSQLENLPGVQVTSLGKANRWDIISFFWKLLGLVRTYRPHVIQSFLDVANSFNVLVGKLTGTKVVLGASASYVDFSRYDWTFRATYKIGAFLSRFADRVIANSYVGEKYNVEQGYSAANISVIPNGIDTQAFRPDPVAGKLMRSQWGVGESERVIGLVGRFDPMKDHSTFLRAAAKVATRFPNSRFVCLGHGPEAYIQAMRNLSNSLLNPEQVLWIIGSSDQEIRAAYNAFDLLVSSSYGEGLPVVLGEAMASGTPCVVTAVGDSAFAVGETGLTVPPQNPTALAEAICTLLALPARERQILGEKARQRVLDHFSIEKMAASYQAVFESITKS